MTNLEMTIEMIYDNVIRQYTYDRLVGSYRFFIFADAI